MPSPTSAIDIITKAMRIIGVLAERETPSAEQATDGLDALNDILEEWNIEGLAVYGSGFETFATLPGKASYTVGPGGDWDTPRPVGVSSFNVTFQGVDFPASEWSQTDYSAVPLKTLRQPIPERFVFINTAPLATIILYPTPSDAVTVNVDFPRILSAIDSIAEAMILPPGYARALQYAVAQELAPQYGTPIDVSSRARSTKAIIKRANRTPQTMNFDAPLVGRWGTYGLAGFYAG